MQAKTNKRATRAISNLMVSPELAEPTKTMEDQILHKTILKRLRNDEDDGVQGRDAVKAKRDAQGGTQAHLNADASSENQCKSKNDQPKVQQPLNLWAVRYWSPWHTNSRVKATKTMAASCDTHQGGNVASHITKQHGGIVRRVPVRSMHTTQQEHEHPGTNLLEVIEKPKSNLCEVVIEEADERYAVDGDAHRSKARKRTTPQLHHRTLHWRLTHMDHVEHIDAHETPGSDSLLHLPNAPTCPKLQSTMPSRNGLKEGVPSEGVTPEGRHNLYACPHGQAERAGRACECEDERVRVSYNEHTGTYERVTRRERHRRRGLLSTKEGLE